MKTLIMLLADGFEEMEAIVPIDLMRRGGIDIQLVSMNEGTLKVIGSRGIAIEADILIQDIMDTYGEELPDAIFFPGGMPGSENIAKHPLTKQILRAMTTAHRLIVAICAAPVVVLAPLGLLDGKNFTCYPGMQSLKAYAPNAHPKAYLTDSVVQDGNLITSRGPGTASALAFKLIELLVDEKTAHTVQATALF